MRSTAGVPVAAAFEGYGDRPTFADVLPLARLVTDRATFAAMAADLDRLVGDYDLVAHVRQGGVTSPPGPLS